MPTRSRPSAAPPGGPAGGPAQFSVSSAARLPLLALSVYLVIRFSMAQDFIGTRFGFNSRYHYVCVPIMVLASIIGGGVFRVFKNSLGLWMLAFTFWMAACLPTSSWRTGSLLVLKDYLLNGFMLFLVMGSLAFTMASQKRVFNALALAMPIFVFITSMTAQVTASERIQMEYGKYGNANSIGTHLLFLSPFLAAYFLTLRRRLGLGPPAVILTFLVAAALFARSGSRSALLALLAVLMYITARLPLRKKFGIALLALFAVPLAVLLLPRATLFRYSTIFSGNEAAAQGVDRVVVERALGSTSVRKLVFWQSVAISFQHPVFGVGPGQFSTFTANESKEAGERALWAVTHNAYTQVSSEMGLIGFFFYAGTLLAIGLHLRRIRKAVRDVPRLSAAGLMALCLSASWIAYCVFSAFDAVAYYQYIPLLAGYTVGLEAAVESELRSQVQAGAEPPAPAYRRNGQVSMA